MYFKRLEVHGFKSFAEPVIIDFHEGVTCIVGPNGSGKSNFSDAIRWVLGEQSPRLLRAGKMEEVIFAGTAARKSRGMAEVTLVIDNSTGLLPIEYNEVAITRRLYRSGESEYLINNSLCRLKDIRELIMDTGIGVEGYSIIGQGRIADIVSSKPEARRQIFEEAAGVVMYKTKKQDAERKLQATDINLDRVNDIIGEIEDRIDTLKDDSEKAREFMELRDRRRELEINITLRNVEKLSESNESAAGDLEEFSAEIEKLSGEKAEADEKVEKARERSQVLEELNNNAKDKLLAKVNEINEITGRYQLDNERLAVIERDKARILAEREALSDKLEKDLAESQKKEDEKEAFRDRIEESSEELKQAISRYNECVSINLEVSDAVEQGKNRIMELNARTAEKRSDIKSYENYRDSLTLQKEKLLKEAEEVTSGKKALDEAIKAAKAELNVNLARLGDNLEVSADIKAKQNALEIRLRDLIKKGEDIRINAGRAAARKKTIEEMESNYEGYNNAVRFIMKSGSRGIDGVVAELMTVPAGFETAIEAALGGALQNIVCRQDSDAKLAINKLKENKAGRLTFLPIESVKGTAQRASDTLKSSRGFEGIAVDLIKFNPEHAGIFNYLLGRTAVVDNMDTAIRLSKISGGLRMVTLDGEIINVGGAITGGKYKNASADLLSRKNEISALGEQITGAEKEYKANQEMIASAEAEKKALADQANALNGETRRMELENAAIKARLASLKESESNSAQAEAKRTRDLKNIENDFETAAALMEKAASEAELLTAETAEISREIEANLLRLEEIKNDLANAGEAVTSARIKKTEVEKSVEAIDSVLGMVLDAIDDSTEQIEARDEALEKLEEQKNRLAFGSDDVEAGVKKLTAEKQELEEYITQVTQEKADISRTLSELVGIQNTLNSKLNSYVDQKQQLDLKMAKNEAFLETAKQKLWDDFEISYAQALELKSEDFVYSQAVKESREIKARMDALGDVNPGAIREYEQVRERYEFLTAQREDITKAADELKTIINDMDRTIRVKFKESFDQVSANFEETFKELFDGGDAELRLLDESNPLESGIDINVQPPGKKVENISSFSGGEQTMIGLALMLAVLKSKPTPFCILDEVEAALDDSNIDKFANSLKKFRDVQFAVITHQKATMEHADVLYGVTMPERGISRVLSLRLGDHMDSGAEESMLKALDADKKAESRN